LRAPYKAMERHSLESHESLATWVIPGGISPHWRGASASSFKDTAATIGIFFIDPRPALPLVVLCPGRHHPSGSFPAAAIRPPDRPSPAISCCAAASGSRTSRPGYA
jgi:hypothetical protein